MSDRTPPVEIAALRQQVVVRNTFLTVVEASPRALRRTASDSQLSSSGRSGLASFNDSSEAESDRSSVSPSSRQCTPQAAAAQQRRESRKVYNPFRDSHKVFDSPDVSPRSRLSSGGSQAQVDQWASEKAQQGHKVYDSPSSDQNTSGDIAASQRRQAMVIKTAAAPRASHDNGSAKKPSSAKGDSGAESAESSKSFYANVAATESLNGVIPSEGITSLCGTECQGPCSFFQKGRCLKGSGCSHCHFDHPFQTRPGKNNRVRAKKKKQREDPLAAEEAMYEGLSLQELQ